MEYRYAPPARPERSHNRGYGIADLLSSAFELNVCTEALSAIILVKDIANDARYFCFWPKADIMKDAKLLLCWVTNHADYLV